MKIRDLVSYPVTLFDDLEQAVKSDRQHTMTRSIPVNAVLFIVAVPIHLKARAANLTHQTVGSGVFVIASASFMLIFALSTLILAVTFWLTRPSAFQEND